MVFYKTYIGVSSLLHDNKPCYALEGHGGKPVWQWPVYEFFNLYLIGEKEEAESRFIDWYYDQYKKYSSVEKSEGGMKNGSLDRLYRQMKTANENISLKDVIRIRVKQRFDLLEDIKTRGYHPNTLDPIKVFRIKPNQYMLFGGHHRVAVLAALGENNIPGVYVFTNNAALFLYRILKKAKVLLKRI